MKKHLPATTPKPATLAVVENEGDTFHLADAYLLTLRTETGRRGMKSAIRKLATVYLENAVAAPVVPEGCQLWSFVPWHRMNAAGVDAMLAKIEGAPATRNKALAALKGIARAGFRMGVVASDDFVKIQATKGARGSREATGRDIPKTELALILEACRQDEQMSGRRDAAMIAFAYATGARREEIVSLTTEQIRDESTQYGQALTGKILGKGDKERSFYVLNGHRELVLEWLRIRGNASGFVFCRTNQRGEIMPESAISTTSAHRALIRRAKQAGVSDVAWHDFRRTVAGDLLDHGIDIATVAGILGHSNVTTTQRYDRRGERAKLAAMAGR